ncbi:MAG TPA: helix-turn-helix transcriptional regulator [Rhizomicrobium sp.]|nr:helix-turn-helix transcriptional regulator [Rhizomicrobium sp.]
MGREIRRRRKDAGLTLAKLGLSSGVHPSYLGGVERADRNVGMVAIFRLARALRVHPADLMDAIP